jgi:hypothetical protein
MIWIVLLISVLDKVGGQPQLCQAADRQPSYIELPPSVAVASG